MNELTIYLKYTCVIQYTTITKQTNIPHRLVLIFYKRQRILLNALLRKHQCPKTILKVSLRLAKHRPIAR